MNTAATTTGSHHQHHHHNNVLKMVFPSLWKPLMVFIKQIMKQHRVKRDWKQCPTYLSQFLSSSMVCVPPDALKQPSDLKNISFDQSLTQNEIVNQVVRATIPINWTAKKHVLSYGYTLAQPGIKSLNSGGVECYFPNTVVNIVKGQIWIDLLKMIGDDLMTYILTHAITLIALPRDSYLQVTGRPLIQYLSDMKERSMYTVALDMKHAFKIKPFQKSLIKKKRKQKKSSAEIPETPDAPEEQTIQIAGSLNMSPIPVGTQSQDLIQTPSLNLSSPILLKSSSDESKSSKTSTEILSDEVEDHYEEPTRKNRKRKRSKPRLSNWRRKKLKMSETSVDTASNQTQLDPEKTVPSEQLVNPKKPKKKELTLPKQTQRTPNSILLPRGMIFYSYRIKPILGFPKNHILNTITPNVSIERQLFSAIFNSLCFNYASDKKPVPVISEKKMQKIQTKYPLLITLLKKLKENQVKQSPSFNHLLDYHCPKPDINMSENMDEMPISQASLYQLEEQSQIMSHVTDSAAESTSDFWSLVDEDILMTQLEVGHNNENEEEPKQDEYSAKFARLIKYFSSHKQVSCFIRAVCKRVIPFEFWGSDHNLHTFHNNVDRFIRLGRYEQFSLHHALQNLKISDMKWCHGQLIPHEKKHRANREEHMKRERLVYQLVYFLFSSVVITLIRTYFYATESNTDRMSVYYFRRSVWGDINLHSWKRLIDQGSVFKRISKNSGLDILKHSKLPCSHIRLLPKETSVRPIINLGHQRNTRGESTNSILRNILFVMRFENDKCKDKLGSSVFSTIEIYTRILPFIRLWKSQTPSTKLYFCCTDIKSAYDTIPHDKCMEVLQNKVFSHKEYMVMKHAIVRPYMGRVSTKYIRSACLPGQFPQIEEVAQNLVKKFNKAVINDQVNHTNISRDAIIDLLRSHIRSNVIKMRSKYYVQTVGIPQGSVLSPFVCSYTYADMERKYLSGLSGMYNILPSGIIRHCLVCRKELSPSGKKARRYCSCSPVVTDFSQMIATNNNTSTISNDDTSLMKNMPSPILSSGSSSNSSSNSSNKSSSSQVEPMGVLVRLIDDFMYVTNSENMAKHFVKMIHEGFPEYGITVNSKKTKLSFDMVTVTKDETVIHEGKRVIRWCGFEINTSTFEVQMDYSKYGGGRLAYKVSRDHKNVGLNIAKKLKQTVSWKCNPLSIDRTANSHGTVCLNVYHLFLFCAMKMHVLLRHKQRNTIHSHRLLIHVVCDIIAYMWICIQSRSKTFLIPNGSYTDITETKVSYLGLIAFRTILKKRKQYKKVLQAITRMLNHKIFKQLLAYEPDAELMKEVTGDKVNERFCKTIRF